MCVCSCGRTCSIQSARACLLPDNEASCFTVKGTGEKQLLRCVPMESVSRWCACFNQLLVCCKRVCMVRTTPAGQPPRHVLALMYSHHTYQKSVDQMQCRARDHAQNRDNKFEHFSTDFRKNPIWAALGLVKGDMVK